MANSKNNKNLSTHIERLPTEKVVDCAQAYVAMQALAGSDGHVMVCSDRAEAVFTVLHGHFIDETSQDGKNHVLISNVEDAPVILGLERLEKLGAFAKKVSVNEKGFLDARCVERYITPRTGLVSLSWGCALTGVVHPIAAIAQKCQEKGVLLHVDATHVAGKLCLDMKELGIDFMNIGGMLFSKEEVKPLICGRVEDEQRILEQGLWAKEKLEQLDHIAMESARLGALFEKALVRRVPDARVMFGESARIPGVCCTSFPGVASELLAFHLKDAGIDVAFGGGVQQNIAHVVKAAGVDKNIAESCISFGIDIDEPFEDAVEIIGEIYDRLSVGVLC